MPSKNTIVVIRGKLNWAKVIGDPKMNTFTEEREWSFDLTPDAAGRKAIKENGISDKLKDPKDKDTRKESFLTLRQREYRTDPATKERVKNKHIPITDGQGNAWDDETLIGNDTVADVKIAIPPKVPGRPRGVYPQAIRVLRLVPYEGGSGFAPLSEDDEWYGATYSAENNSNPAKESEASDDDLEDEIPF